MFFVFQKRGAKIQSFISLTNFFEIIFGYLSYYVELQIEKIKFIYSALSLNKN